MAGFGFAAVLVPVGSLDEAFRLAQEGEVDAAIAQAITDTGAGSPADMGKVMAALKAALAGRADMGQVSARVKRALAG